MFNILLWWVVLQTDNNIDRDVKDFLSYYLLVAGSSIITMARYGKFGKGLLEHVRYGTLNAILLKPVKVLPYIYFETTGSRIVTFLMAIPFIIAGIIISDIHIVGLVSFILFVTLAAIIAFGWNVLEAGIPALLLSDFSGIRNVTNHVTSLLSGFLFPIYLFPDTIEEIIRLSPFPVLVYNPIHVLSFEEVNSELIEMLALSIFWVLVINSLAIRFWQRSIKKYEAIGA